MPRRSGAPRSIRRRTNGLRTRAEIVAAAERHFAEQGFQATRLEDIAREVGIRRAAIFYHFGDEQELYAAVLKEVFRGWEAALPTTGSAAERLEASLTGWIDFVAERPNVARLVVREAANAPPGKAMPFAAMPWLTLNESVAPWGRAELAKHKREILLVARGMLGIPTGSAVDEVKGV